MTGVVGSIREGARIHGTIGLAAVRIGLGVLVLTAGACATTNDRLTPSASTTTLMAGWEYRFKLDWSVDPERDKARRIRGYIASQHGQYAEPVRILVLALDPSGAVVGTRIQSIPGGVGGLGRVYFEVPRVPAADHYRVTVWDYTILESDTPLR